MSRFSFLAVLAAALFVTTTGLDNGLARKPQMGWNSWNHFACNLNEATIRSTAKTIVDSGLAKVGYNYVNLDDCWADHRDNATRVIPGSNFPGGMFQLGEYIHSLGLKFGIYSDSGTHTCAGRPGSLHHEVIDALTYAAWGIDYLKYDNCYDDGTKPEVRYPPMRDALNATGRPILFSMCEWGVDDPARWSGEVGNSWRTTGDINDSWKSMISNLDQNDRWWNYSGPGHWNDPDMLEVGNGGMTDAEYQAHFSLWALIKSPLLIGCDVTKMSDATKTILMNEEVIALSQDDLGVQGHKLYADPSTGGEIWGGPLANGDMGVILFNRGNSSVNFTLGFSQHLGLNPQASVAIRDLVAHKDLGSFSQSFSAVVNGHASQTLRLAITTAVHGSKRLGKVRVAGSAGAGARRYQSINEAYDEHPGMIPVFGGRRL